MARINTSTQRRLTRLHRRRDKEIKERTYKFHKRLYEFDASICIAGIGERHEEILIKTGIKATSMHLKGQPRSKGSTFFFPQDAWILESPLARSSDIEEHLAWLWDTISPHQEYFKELVSNSAHADLWLGCFSESPYPVLEANSESLTMLRELNFGLAFNFTCV